MFTTLAALYPWTKALHIIAVIAWMAGLFYLPRLLVYHVEQIEPGSAADTTFKTMERRLLRAIMNPAMIATWVFGIALAATPGLVGWQSGWIYVKLVAVAGLTFFHHWLARRVKDFANGQNKISGRSYRLMNEVPTVALIVIVTMVVVRPF